MAISVQKMGKLSGFSKGWLYFSAAIAAFVLAVAVDTTVVVIGSDDDLRQQAFSPDDYGRQEFPRIQDFVSAKAIDAGRLASELQENKQAAIDAHATMAGAFPVFPVRFEGQAGEEKSGIFEVIVDGLPEGTKLRVQTGPAINGTELRDIPGDIEFGAFTNQIEYQNVGAGINKAMIADILAELNRETLTGKRVSVVGAFKLINPKNWLVTPVEFNVK